MSEQAVDPAATPQPEPPPPEQQKAPPSGFWGRVLSSSLLVTFLAFVVAMGRLRLSS